MSLKPPTQSTLPVNEDDILNITIRFSASLPDLLLTINLTSQPHANTSTLKQLLRPHLPSEYTKKRIRLIYSGKALGDDVLLTSSLRRPTSKQPSRVPTPRPGTPSNAIYDDTDTPTAKVKGKTPIRDPTTPITRIYIHCSLGDLTLTPTELSAEAAVARSSPKQNQTSTTIPSSTFRNATPSPPPPPPQLHGFDRLSSSGFTPSEIASLRLQFLAIQAHTHTPDTMPSPTTLRALEDRWLDNSSSPDPLSLDSTGALGAGGGGMGSSDEDTDAGALDDMIYGTAMGFFWPIGCLMWAVREEGVWSQRRKMAVVVGVVLNLGVGFLRFGG